jgi:hypothetical protein
MELEEIIIRRDGPSSPVEGCCYTLKPINTHEREPNTN